MAGRLHTGSALASAAELLTQMNLARQDHDRQLQLKAIELYGKFTIEQKLQEQDFQHQRALKRMELGYPEEGGALPTFDTTSLAEGQSYKRKVSGGELTTKAPIDVAKEGIAALVSGQKLLPPEGGFLGFGQHPPPLSTQGKSSLQHYMDIVSGGRRTLPDPSGALPSLPSPALTQPSRGNIRRWRSGGKTYRQVGTDSQGIPILEEE